MKAISLISRILVGVLFVYSGFVKAVDPLGSTYKFIDYFNDAFHLPALEPLAFPLAILMCAAELTLGIMLLINILPRVSAYGAALLMLFFTPLTLFLAITNAVQDCGCFGDAIKLTNWQTFWKNIIILIPVIAYLITYKQIVNPLKKNMQVIAATIVMLFALGFEYYNYNHLPIIDFMPYKVGNNIPANMKIPEGAPQDSFTVSLVYKNVASGEIKEFSMEEYPQDTTWEWVETKTKLIKEGYRPAIYNFSITNTEDFDITEEVLTDAKPVFLLIAYNLDSTEPEGFDNIKYIWDYAKQKSFRFYTLTASSSAKMIDMNAKIGYDMEYCSTDETTLKTVIRSNPGLVLIKNGTVMGKWHFNDYPELEGLEKIIN